MGGVGRALKALRIQLFQRYRVSTMYQTESGEKVKPKLREIESLEHTRQGKEAAGKTRVGRTSDSFTCQHPPLPAYNPANALRDAEEVKPSQPKSELTPATPTRSQFSRQCLLSHEPWDFALCLNEHPSPPG